MLVGHVLVACGDAADLYEPFENGSSSSAGRGGARAVPIGSAASEAGAAGSMDDFVGSGGGSGSSSGGAPAAEGGRGAQGGASGASMAPAMGGSGEAGGGTPSAGGARETSGEAGSAAGSEALVPSEPPGGCSATFGGAFAMGGALSMAGAAGGGAGGEGAAWDDAAGGATDPSGSGGTSPEGAAGQEGEGGAGQEGDPTSGDGGNSGAGGAGGAGGSPTVPDAGEAPIFFSEYVEGTGNRKALEITASADALLDGCAVRVFANGSRSASRIVPLAGVLPAGETLVICTSEVAAIVPNACDRIETLPFNGDDAVVLECGGVVVDAIGRLGEDPGAAWESGDVRTLDCTLRRRCTVERGDADAEDPFDPSAEWTAAPTDSVDGLGAHCAAE
nr:MAG: hypothetical protein DIU78_13585 [Pseudomonadota bacterium]